MSSRRQFLAQTVSLMGAIGLSPAFGGLSARAASDYKAVVCILLAGGADSFNILVPRSEIAYRQYEKRRSNLALSHRSLLPLDGAEGGVQFGLHSALPQLQQLYNTGRLAFVSNIGPLVEPTTRDAFDENAVRLPLGLYSHSDQIVTWQTSKPFDRANSGVGGRIMDALTAINSGPTTAHNISLSGTNTFQANASAPTFALGRSTIETFGYYNHPKRGEPIRQAVDAFLSQENMSTLHRIYSDKMRSAIAASDLYTAALAHVPLIGTAFSNDIFSQSMKRIAEVISIRDVLGATRQTFFVKINGWDHHADLLLRQSEMLPILDAGLGQFSAAIDELGVGADVTAFTVSDFGRTLTSNGKGSDHGWGGNMMVVGGSVNGGRVYGQFPELVPDNPLDVGRGRLIPSTSTDAFYAEIARWMGVAESSMADVLPNWSRFVGTPQGSGLDDLMQG